jgi:hypothetical protein
MIDKTKGLVAKVALAHYMVAGLSIGSMLLLLYGAFLTLAKSLDPAAAAGILGAVVALVLTGAALFFTRPREP